MKTKLRLSILAAAILAAHPAFADEREDVETVRQTTVNLIQTLVQSGILTQEKADTLIREAKRSAAETVAAQNAGNKVVRVPYIPVTVRNEIKEELRKEVMTEAKAEGWVAPSSMPGWLEGTKWEADIRIRAQHDQFDNNNFTPLQLSLAIDPIALANSQQNNDRMRLRLRLGMEKKLSDMTTMGFRLATGNLSDPISTNQTQGNSFNRFTLGVDRAFLKFHPLTEFDLLAGRFANPFFSTDLVWDSDLNFDGVAATYRDDLLPFFNKEETKGFITMGAFPLTKIDTSSTTTAKSKWLFGAQTGVEVKSGATGLKLAMSLYEYKNVEGKQNTGDLGIDSVAAKMNDGTAPQFRQKGNSIFDINQLVTGGAAPLYGLASKFRELNLTGSIGLAHFDPVHVVLTGDFVKNIGFDRDEILRRTGRNIEAQTNGYHAQLTVGMPVIAKDGDWQAFAAYKYLERDAVPDAFTDSDFRLGGTDSKGYILGGNYGIDKNTWLSLKWLSADPISGPPLSIDVLQLDVNSRF